jgi:GxxExxY protein
MQNIEYLHSEITDLIIKCFYKVYNKMGYGFLEKVYQNSLLIELRNAGLFCEPQKQIKVLYQNQIVGEYFADIVVNDCVIVELKAAETLVEEREFQLINYLKATEVEVGLLLNFGKKPEVKRKIFTNERLKQRASAKSASSVFQQKKENEIHHP